MRQSTYGESIRDFVSDDGVLPIARKRKAGNILIGDYCAINSFARLFGHGGIKMGNYSQIGPGSLITTTTHNYREALTTEFKEVNIGEWAWVGAHCVLLPGVTIGEHSVIGAGSIVTKDIPAYSIAVGIPAKVIGKNEKD